MTPPGAGRDLDGYQLERRIGQGAMGEVYLARDLLLERPVAIKFIAAGQVDETARQRFMVEARAIARLQHPNVVTIYRIGEHEGLPYLVSEYIDGTPLDELATPMEQGRLLEIGLGLSRGLAMAHRAGVVHRDIKPANAILSAEGQVKLLDFGIAKLIAAQPGLGAPAEPRGAGGPGGWFWGARAAGAGQAAGLGLCIVFRGCGGGGGPGGAAAELRSAWFFRAARPRCGRAPNARRAANWAGGHGAGHEGRGSGSV